MKLTRKLLLGALTLVVFFLIIFNVTYFKQGQQCLANPLVYGVENAEKANDAPFSCRCTLLEEPSVSVYINSTGIYDGIKYFSPQ